MDVGVFFAQVKCSEKSGEKEGEPDRPYGSQVTDVVAHLWPRVLLPCPLRSLSTCLHLRNGLPLLLRDALELACQALWNGKEGRVAAW